MCPVLSSLLNQKTLRCGQTYVSISTFVSVFFFFFFLFVCFFFFFFCLFFFFFYHGQDFIIFSYSCFDLSAYLLFGFIRNIWKCANSKAWVLYSNSAVNIYDSKAYRNMAMTRERNDFTFDPKDIESPN